MFNMTNIGKQISKRRKELNLTQVELADQLLVSYQAVSQWENGKSMPELSNLTRLAEVLQVPLEELLGQKQARVVEQVIEDEQLDEEDLIEAAPYIKPEAMKHQVEGRSFDSMKLTALAPFLDSKTLKKYARSGSTANLIALAPFLDDDHLEELLLSKDPTTISPALLVGLAPFVSSKTLMKILLSSDQPIKTSAIVPLAPFLKSKHLDQLMDEGRLDDINSGALVALAPFLSQKSLKRKLKQKPEEKPQPAAEVDDVEFVAEEPEQEVPQETEVPKEELHSLISQLKQLLKSGS